VHAAQSKVQSAVRQSRNYELVDTIKVQRGFTLPDVPPGAQLPLELMGYLVSQSEQIIQM